MKALVVGTGSMGRHHARVWADMQGVRLAGVADISLDRAQAVTAEHGGQPFSHHVAALEAVQPDVVSVCVPTSAHFTVSSDALDFGASVLVEKPVTGSVEQATALKRRAELAGRVLACGYVERFNPALHTAKTLIDAGSLGSVRGILARRVGLMPSRITDTDVIRDLMVHDIDACRFLLSAGEPASVAATGGAALLSDRIDHAEALLGFGVVGALLQTNWITPVKVRELVITGDRGYAEVDLLQQAVVVHRPRGEASREFSDYGEFLAASEGHWSETLPVPRYEPLTAEIAAFANAVRGHDEAHIVTVDDAITTLRVASAVVAAAKQAEASI